MVGINPHVETLDAWVGLGIRQRVPTQQLPELFARTFTEVAAAAGRAGAVVVGPAYAEYFGEPGATVDVEIGFGVDHAVEVPGMTATERPSRRAVVGTHIGPYDTLSESYAELMPWLELEAMELGESMFEFYDSPPETDPESTVTRLVFPLA